MSNFFVKGHTSFVGQAGYNAHAQDFFTALSHITDLKLRNFTVGKSWKGLGSKNINGKYNDPHTGELYLNDYQRKLICEQTLYCNEDQIGYYGSGLCDYEVNDGLNYLKKYKENDIIEIILAETDHHYYYCLEKYKGFKIAYNVWESTLYEDKFFEQLKKFDQFWCASEWQKECIIKQGYPVDKIFVVPEAVDGNIFKPDYFDYELDLYKDNRFKFIIFGRWEYRKATKEIIETFLRTFKKDEPVDLIISVDNEFSPDNLKTTENRLNYFNLRDDRIKIVHFLDRENYIKFLQNGHVYLSCSRSEGWNLPLIESLACGTPSIYSNCSAQLEFAKGKGHPVRIIGEKPIPDGIGNYYEPDFQDLSKIMRDVYINYWKYKNKALKDSEIIRKDFSWNNSVQKALSILNNIVL